MLSAKLYFIEIGPVHQKLWPSTCMMLKTLNSNFLDSEDTSTRKQFKVHPLSSGKVAATPHLKICPISIFAFYCLNYSLAARLQDNFSPNVAHKSRDKEKITAIYCLWMVDSEGGRESGSEKKKENFKAEITFNIKCRYNY